MVGVVRRNPRSGHMTLVTGEVCRQVCCGFSCRRGSVAIGTGSWHHLSQGMVKCRADKGGGVIMTQVAFLSRDNMCRRFDKCSHRIPLGMTGRTGRHNTCMIHPVGGKCGRAGVTTAAVGTIRIAMNHVVLRRHSGSTAFMAGGAASCDPRMVIAGA